MIPLTKMRNAREIFLRLDRGVVRARYLPKTSISYGQTAPNIPQPLDIGANEQYRNAITVNSDTGLGGLAPHAAANRFRYIVPINRRSYLEFCRLALQRVTAPTVSGLVQIQARMVDLTGFDSIFLNLLFNSPTVDSIGVQEKMQSNKILLLPGSQFFFRTIDVSTGGIINYQWFAKFTEFDS